MRIPAGSCSPLYISKIGTACHCCLSITPVLGCNPIERIVSILYFVIIRLPSSGTVFSSPCILNNDCIASPDKAIIHLYMISFSIRSPHKYRRHFSHIRSGFSYRKINVCCQSFSISCLYKKCSVKLYLKNFLKGEIAPGFQDCFFFLAILCKHCRIISSRH